MDKERKSKLPRRADSSPYYIYMSLSFACSVRPWKVFGRGVVVEVLIQCVGQKSLIGVYSRGLTDVSNDHADAV